MQKLFFTLLLSLSLLLTACNSPETVSVTEDNEESSTSISEGLGLSEDVTPLIPNYNFRPIDDIIDTDLEVTDFAPDGTAILPITTSVPVACTVVFGTTREFGQLSLDQDMDGGTHSDHSPLLSNLIPDTEYFFRVQGIDDDGNLYLSEIMSFTTPPESAFIDENAETNWLSLAAGAQIIEVSSNFGGAANNENWGAEKAIDNSGNSAWSSNGDGDNAFIVVQLAEEVAIDRLSVHTRAMSNDTAQIFEFTVTNELGETAGPFELPDASQAYEFEVDLVASQLRFDAVRTNTGNTGFIELGAFGTPTSDGG